MARAVALARKGLYSSDPNPRVGCILVKQGAIIGEGFHLRAGEAHAEINALRQAGAQARGATAYVTLEPCSHHGKTPPCSEALIAAGIDELYMAMEDPNPLVRGRGKKALQDHGITVHSGLLAAEAEALNPGFVMRMRSGRPFVRCKLAMSVDGRTAMASGESQWITGAAARKDLQQLRARSSAIITGIGTVLKDDPQLTVRLQGASRQPLRVILDPRLSTPPGAKILQPPGEVLIVTASNEPRVAEPLTALGVEVVQLAQGRDRIDLPALMALLAEREMNELHLETGATLSGAFLRAGLIDELILYIAPKLMGDSARGLFHTPGLEKMADAVNLNIEDIRAVGSDWRLTITIRK
ncbi:MAG: bifunctional diaminohydroxyphosphoribosylaminopyrimidine deaminase/5-amino-6-(5-phosphoribosylamino)uracil reductase RibD [Gammaproteobacteria bacterium]|nr:bifunctional diaminohydroxyphosphoribosylaminopyrimidine deaminase/5-amino-6-(5-phosphoribosylamino)uracil reductase RibD [Gammaproteobacteria bacterium]